MIDESQIENVIGATITATATVLVGGCDAARNAFSKFDDTVIVDWYIGDGERAEADDVVGKLVGSEAALKSAAQAALELMQNASIGDADSPYFRMHYRID